MASPSREYQEKRNFIRMKIDTPADIELVDGSKIEKGVCRDLSGSGMLVGLHSTFAIGTELRIRIAAHHSHAPMLEADTKVIRVLEGDDTHKHLIGLEIITVID